MREIKFKWVGRNRMFDEITFSQPLTTTEVLKGSYYSFFSLRNREEGGNCEFIDEIRFTGLKDNKRTKEFPDGQEIYEGDICEIRYNNTTPTVTGVVKWFSFHTHFSIATKKGGPYSISFGGSIVDGVYVIGNIYQDSELLK